MLHRFAPLTHLLRVLVQALLDSFKNMLVFPACDPTFLAGRAALPDGTALARIGPIAVQRQSFFFVGEVVDQAFAGGTKIDILARHIAKVLFDGPTVGCVAEVSGLGGVTVIPASSQARISILLK
jgi:hypothetical protein